MIWVGVSWWAAGFAAIAYFIRMFGITGIYHRYFSHRTYKLNRFWQFIAAVIGNSQLPTETQSTNARPSSRFETGSMKLGACVWKLIRGRVAGGLNRHGPLAGNSRFQISCRTDDGCGPGPDVG